MKNKIKKGLQELPLDSRDFQLGSLVTLPKLSELPVNFSLPQTVIKDQKDTDFCTAYTSSTLAELQDGVEFSPEWLFAASKEISGDLDQWGQNLRDAMKPLVKFGALPQEEAEYTVSDYKKARDIKNWAKDTFEKALPYKKKTYVAVTGPYDTFDNIRATIWSYRKENRAVAIGLYWKWSLDEQYLTRKNQNRSNFGHAVPVVGWEGDFLKIKQSAGRSAGYKGYQWIHKDIINTEVERFGVYMIVDLTPEEVRVILQKEKSKGIIIKVFVQLFIKGHIKLAWEVLTSWIGMDTKKKL